MQLPNFLGMQTNLHLENSSSAPLSFQKQKDIAMAWMPVSPSSSYAEVSTLKDAGSRRGGLIHEAGAPVNGISAYKREIPSTLPHVWTQWEVSDLRGASLNPAGTWSDFQPPELWERNFCCL